MIYSFTGACGHGKSLMMVIQAYKDHLNGVPVYSNIKLEFPFIPLTKDFFNNYKNLGLKKCSVIFDELSLFVPARRSMSNKNVDFFPFVLQTRKSDVKMYFTAQQRNLVDIIVRNNVDGEYALKMYVKRGKQVGLKPEDWDHKDGDEYSIVAEYYDKNNQYGQMMFKKKIIIHHAEKYFNLYDTYEIIDFNMSGSSEDEKILLENAGKKVNKICKHK